MFFVLKELSIKQKKYNLHCDDQSGIDLSKNATYHSRIRHIDVHYDWIGDALRTFWCKLSRLTQAEIRQKWWWNLYQRRSMSFAGVWQAWFQFEDPFSSRDWGKIDGNLQSHNEKALHLPHEFTHDSLSTACIHAWFFSFSSIGEVNGVGYEDPSLFYKKREDGSIAIITNE